VLLPVAIALLVVVIVALVALAIVAVGTRTCCRRRVFRWPSSQNAPVACHWVFLVVPLSKSLSFFVASVFVVVAFVPSSVVLVFSLCTLLLFYVIPHLEKSRLFAFSPARKVSMPITDAPVSILRSRCFISCIRFLAING